jgi:hypothetical protein
MNKKDQILLEYVDNTYGKTPWWNEFVYNIKKQGWMSDKQRFKLQCFDKEHARRFEGLSGGYDQDANEGPYPCGVQWSTPTR